MEQNQVLETPQTKPTMKPALQNDLKAHLLFDYPKDEEIFDKLLHDKGVPHQKTAYHFGYCEYGFDKQVKNKTVDHWIENLIGVRRIPNREFLIDLIPNKNVQIFDQVKEKYHISFCTLLNDYPNIKKLENPEGEDEDDDEDDDEVAGDYEVEDDDESKIFYLNSIN